MHVTRGLLVAGTAGLALLGAPWGVSLAAPHPPVQQQYDHVQHSALPDAPPREQDPSVSTNSATSSQHERTAGVSPAPAQTQNAQAPQQQQHSQEQQHSQQQQYQKQCQSQSSDNGTATEQRPVQHCVTHISAAETRTSPLSDNQQ